ncbi:MAG: hypothetical protein J6Q22_10655 [Prevotella sp.]|nr:hypothetical protein [Prevotella sp.]
MRKEVAMEVDNEQVRFIEDTIADSSKTWEQRFDSIVSWRKKNRRLLGLHITLNPTIKEGDVNVEKVAEELCKIALESAKGTLEEVPLSEL